MLKLASLVFVLLFTFAYAADATDRNSSVHYACLTEIYSNGRLAKTDLVIFPAREEYRYRNFEVKSANGTGAANALIPANSAAQHHAIATLLAEKGLKSVKSEFTRKDIHYSDRVLVTYEGLIRLPPRKTSYRWNEDRSLSAAVEIDFTPLADPSEWKSLHIKKRMGDFLGEILDLFYFRSDRN